MSPSARLSSAAGVLRFLHRWIRRAATALLLASCLAVATAVLLWSLGAEFLAARATAFLNARVLGAETRLVVGEVKGTPFRRLVLAGVRIERTSSEGSYAILSARELELTYDLWGLLHGRYVISQATAQGLELDFRTEGNKLLLPTFRKGAGNQQSPAPAFRIRKLNARGGTARVQLPWRTVFVDSLAGEISVESGRDGLRFGVGTLHGVLGDGLGRVDLDHGAFQAGRSIRLENLEGMWDGSAFAVSGTASKGAVDLDIRVGELPLERLGRFLLQPHLEPGYVKRARGTLRAQNGRVTFDVDAEATWETWSADSLAGKGIIENGMLRLRDVEASIEGASFTGVDLDIPLHEPQFTARGRAKHLDTATLRIPFFDLVPGTIGGRAEIRFLDRKLLGRNMDLRVWAEQGELLQIPIRSGRVVAKAREGVFQFDTLVVNLDGARAAAAGKTSEDFLDLNMVYEGRVEPLRRLLRRPEAAGSATLHGTLNGPPRSPILVGSGEIRDLEIASVRAPLVRVEEAVGPLNEGQNLRVRAIADHGVTVGELYFATGETRFAVARDSVQVTSLALAHGDTTVTAHGSFRWEPEINAWVEGAEAMADGRSFVAREPFRLILREEEVVTPALRLETKRGSLDLAGFWNFAQERFSVKARLRDVDPSVFFPPESPPPVAVGKITGVLDLTGSSEALTGRVDLGLREIDWKRGHLDSVYAAGSIEGGQIRIENLMARRGGGRVDVRGEIQLPEAVVAAVRGLRERRYPDPEKTGYRLEAEASGLDLGEWKFLLPPTQQVRGKVTLRAALEGTSAHPVLHVEGGVDGITWRGFEADSIAATAGFAEGTLRVARLRLLDKGQSVELSGSFPLDLAFFPFAFGVPDRAMDLRVEAENGSLRGLELTPWIRKAEGTFRARLGVQGTPKRPLVEGWARVDGGRVELRERDEVVENITARFAMSGDLVRVEEARGNLTVRWARPGTQGGLVTADGTYRLAALDAQSYRLHLTVRDGLVGEEGVYAARVSGDDLELEPVVASDGRLYPSLRGSLFVDRLEYAGNLKPQDIAEFKPPSILYEVSINAPEDVRVQTDRAQAELGGELTARRTVERQQVLGTLEILSGSYQFFQKTFRVTAGNLNWNSPNTLIPSLDIQAETKAAGYRILVDLQGPADQPELSFTAESLEPGSSQDLTQDEIIQLLALGAVGLSAPEQISSSSESKTRPGEAAAGWGLLGAQQLFGSELERKLAQSVGISMDVQVETESSKGEFEPKVGIRTYVTPDFSLQYLQGLSRTYEQDVAVEYRLRRRILVLRGSVINLPLQSKQEYNLDLKLRHEY